MNLFHSIKISELDPIYSASILTEDFFPLVHSQSMTTYRATLEAIGQLMTHSIYADTASYSAGAISASHADWADNSISASYAKTASWALNIPSVLSASWASRSMIAGTADQALYASRSHDALYATRSLDVDTSGRIFNFPYWNTVDGTPGTNAALQKYSPLSAIGPNFDADGWWTYGPVIVDSGSTLVIGPSSASYFPYYWFSGSATGGGADFTYTRYNPQANKLNANWGPGGFQTYWPITSQTFIGCDQRFWTYYTASNPFTPWTTNQYFSGSAGGPLSGSWQTIPAAAGGISSSFNGKWVRIISADSWGPASLPEYGGASKHPAVGEMTQTYGNLGGLIKLQANTPAGSDPVGGYKSNAQSTIWAHIFTGMWGSPPQITILSSNNYSRQLITALRMGCGYGRDSVFYLDLLIDNISAGDERFYLEAQSFNGGIRFLSTPNWGPWRPMDTGSNEIRYDWRHLTVPNAPGHYSAIDPQHHRMSYYFQGQTVVINPTINEITQSGLAYAPNASTLSLHVSGGINASDAFYCDNNRGLTTKVTYGTTNLYFSGGILISKYPPDSYVPPASIPCGTSLKYAGGQAMPTEQFFTLGSATGPVIVKYDMYDNPDRLQVWFDGVVKYDTGYRGDPARKSYRDAGLNTYGSGSETSSPIYSPGQGQFTWYKDSATSYCMIQVFAPGAGTAWNYTMSCPNQPLPT